MADIVQKQATVEQIIEDHVNGIGGYAIAEKYGLDTEKVKQILQEANDAGKFIPDGIASPVDFAGTRTSSLQEGVNPSADIQTTDKKGK